MHRVLVHVQASLALSGANDMLWHVISLFAVAMMVYHAALFWHDYAHISFAFIWSISVLIHASAGHPLAAAALSA
jgi:hypothetical protein